MTAQPHQWSPEELETYRRASREFFVQWFEKRGNQAYRDLFQHARQTVFELMTWSANLTRFRKELVSFKPTAKRNLMREALRYVAGPPVSDDDLVTLARGEGVWEASKLNDFLDVIEKSVDPERFPWVSEGRDPRADEMTLAINWTAGLIASTKAGTIRRTESYQRQEQAVDDAIGPLGFDKVKVKAKAIESVRAMAPGTYCRSKGVGGTRADLVIALRDDRLLALECKVSGSEVNSYKRLVHEVGDKAARWRTKFGESVVAGAVLAGAFSVANLQTAQVNGVALFWEHDLRTLQKFLEEAVP